MFECFHFPCNNGKHEKVFFYSNYKATLDIKKNDKDGLDIIFNYLGSFDLSSKEEILIKKEYKCTDLIVKADAHLNVSINYAYDLACLGERYNFYLYKEDNGFFDKYIEKHKSCGKEYPMYFKRKKLAN